MLNSSWWKRLDAQWQNAFAVTVFRHFNAPSGDELEQLYNSPAIRFAGPSALYPNMGFELTDISGVEELKNLEILVITHHQIKEIASLKSLRKLKSLFLFNNQIQSLEGIERLENLEQLYVQCNKISSLEPLRKLTNLKEVYVNNNLITSLDGLTEAHSANLTNFYCMPNSSLPQKEIIRVENQLGVKCKGV